MPEGSKRQTRQRPAKSYGGGNEHGQAETQAIRNERNRPSSSAAGVEN